MNVSCAGDHAGFSVKVRLISIENLKLGVTAVFLSRRRGQEAQALGMEILVQIYWETNFDGFQWSCPCPVSLDKQVSGQGMPFSTLAGIGRYEDSQHGSDECLGKAASTIRIICFFRVGSRAPSASRLRSRRLS